MKFITSEELYNPEDKVHWRQLKSVISLRLQPRNQKKAETWRAMRKELEKCKDLSLKNKAKMIHAMVCVWIWNLDHEERSLSLLRRTTSISPKLQDFKEWLCSIKMTYQGVLDLVFLMLLRCPLLHTLRSWYFFFLNHCRVGWRSIW